MSQIIDNLYLTFHYLSAVICQNSSSKWCWQDNLEFHRCLVSYGKCFKMLPGFVGYQHFHVKIIRCRFERNFIKNIWASQCHKDQTGQQVFFCVQKQEILYNNLFYFTRNKLWWWTNKTPSELFVYSLVPPLVFALLEYFAKFSKIYTSSGRQRLKTKPDQNLLDCGQMVWFQHSTMSDFI